MNFLFAAPDIDFDTQLTMEVLRELSISGVLPFMECSMSVGVPVLAVL